jgi:hypothetical protein
MVSGGVIVFPHIRVAGWSHVAADGGPSTGEVNRGEGRTVVLLGRSPGTTLTTRLIASK